MDKNELDFITQIVTDVKPRKIIEVGTADGDSSTLALATGLYRNGTGHLDTWEINELYYNNALSFFKDNVLKQYITFHLGDFLSNSLPTEFFADVDLVLLDGGDTDIGDGIFPVSLAIFKYVTQRVGNIDFILHDWNAGRGHYVKQYLDKLDWSTFAFKKELNSPYGVAHIKKEN